MANVNLEFQSEESKRKAAWIIGAHHEARQLKGLKFGENLTRSNFSIREHSPNQFGVYIEKRNNVYNPYGETETEYLIVRDCDFAMALKLLLFGYNSRKQNK